MTTAAEKKLKSRKCGKFILTCVVLLGSLIKYVYVIAAMLVDGKQNIAH